MKKEEIKSNGMMRILVKLLLREYQAIQETKSALIDIHPKELRASYTRNYLKWDVGNENPSHLRGLLIVPGLFSCETYSKGVPKFESIDSIESRLGSIFEFFYEIKPEKAEKATIIGEYGIANGLHLDVLTDHAEKILEKKVEEIFKMYALVNESCGTRMEAAVAAAIILNNRGMLKKMFGFDISKYKPIEEYKEAFKFYCGNIFCKRTTIINDTYTGPIFMFTVDEVGNSAKFFFQGSDNIEVGLKAKYPNFQDYYYSKNIVGVLQIAAPSPIKDEEPLKKSYLIKPSDFGLATEDLNPKK